MAHERLQRKAAGRQEAVAFEIDLTADDVEDDDETVSTERTTPPANKPARNEKNSHPSKPRGSRDMRANSTDEDAGRTPSSVPAGAPLPNRRVAGGGKEVTGARSRRGWGAPVDPFKAQAMVVSGGSSDAVEVEEEEALTRMQSEGDRGRQSYHAKSYDR